MSKLLILAALIIGAVLGAFVLSRRTPAGDGSNGQLSAVEPVAVEGAKNIRSSLFTRGPRRPSAQANSESQSPGGPGSATSLITGWEEKLDEILGASSPDLDKAKQMLEMLPQLPASGQEEAAQHITNLLPDADYGLMYTSLTNSALPEDVLDVLLGDVLNRPNSLKLPALLAVARSPQHPKAAEAKDFLELLLDEDYQNDWDKWQVKMNQWLAANPD